MRVLVADDEPVVQRMLQVLLRPWGYEVVVASDGTEALQILRQPDPPRLVILDWLMPGMSGIELCREIRSREQEPYTYVLLLTAKQSKQEVVEGLEAGADDYITKPFNSPELQMRLRAGTRILGLQQQLVDAYTAAREQAMHDPLTGLWNRTAIFQLLEQELVRANRQKSSVGVALVDLDHFKRINDTHGHLFGDTVLQAVSEAMRAATRAYDSVGRLGGEEFMIVLPDCDQANAMICAERVRTHFSQLLLEAKSGPVAITASLGVTATGDDQDCDAYGLMRDADEALYRAKRSGRDRVELAGATGWRRLITTGT